MIQLPSALRFSLCFSLLLLAVVSCDVGNEPSFQLTAQDLSTSIVENPGLGTEIGQVIASAEGAQMVFSVLSSAPAGAFTIDGVSGVLKVADDALFDFETNVSLTAVVQVTAGTESREVNVLVLLEDEEANIEDYNRITNSWKTAKFSFGGIFAAMDVHACRLDDKMIISGTGNYTYDGGVDLCGNEDNQQLKTGTWDLDEHLQFILFDKGEVHEFRANIDFFAEDKIALSGTWMGVLVSGEYVPE